MRINLNDEIWTGIDVKHKDKRGRIINREFQRIAITTDQDRFLTIAQYIIDSAPDTSNIVIIHRPTNTVIDFTGLINTIGMKSKRYSKEA